MARPRSKDLPRHSKHSQSAPFGSGAVQDAQESSHTHKLWVPELVGVPIAPRGAPHKKVIFFLHFVARGFRASKLDSHHRITFHTSARFTMMDSIGSVVAVTARTNAGA